MIDTDKYEGHTLNHPIHMDEPNPHDGGHREMLCDGGIVGWLQMDDYPSADVNAMLLADAPLLLEEVKRLREKIKTERNLKLWEKAEVKQLRKELDAAEDVILYALDRVGNDDDAKKVFEDFLEVIK